MSFNKAWYGKGDMLPEFRPSGLALDRWQFCYRNVVGEGAKTKRRAITNWLKQLLIEVRK